MASLFGAALAGWIEELGVSQREFARRAEFSQANLSQVILGNRPPPVHQLGTWIRVLELDQEQQDRFHVLALETLGLDDAAQRMRQLLRGASRR